MDIIISNTLFTGKVLNYLPKVDSTNNFAKELLTKNTPIDGTVILADEQFAGRGQIGNKWQSEPNKNLTFSIIYQTKFLKASEQFWLNKVISLGVCALVNSVYSGEEKVTIKWPNDIYVGKKKIAGILIENTIYGEYLNYSIIGIGLNVNQQVFEDAISATSLRRLLDKETDRISLLRMLLAMIERYYMLLKENKFELLHQTYIENLYQYKISSFYRIGDIIFRGQIIQVDDFGYLVLETEDGIKKFGFKEISYMI